jgi:tetratricopeptide (TPR) repeat protein
VSSRARPTSGVSALIAALVVGLIGGSARADRLLTVDGRDLHPRKARVEGQGYRFVFENGEIVVPSHAGIQSVEIEGDMSEYVPQNDDEREKLAQGYVRYKGKWFSKPGYADELRHEFEKSRARTEDLARHSDWDHGWTKETQHFVFKTNTSPELLDYYSELIEAYYRLMDDRIGINPSPTMRRTKMEVNVFKSRDEFRKLSNFGNEKMPAGVIGFFSPMTKSLNFFHEWQEPSRTSWVALHECTHLLTFLVDQHYQPQIWVNEGVADYFGSSRIERDKSGKITIHPGELQLDRVLTVQQAILAGQAAQPATGKEKAADKPGSRRDTTLEELFLLKREEFDGFQYAHAWSFVYFLNHYENGKYAKAFAHFFKGLYSLEKPLKVDTSGGGKAVSPEDIRKYLLSKLGLKDTAGLEKEWKDFIASIAVEGPVAQLKRGMNAMRQFDFKGALPDLDAAIAAGTVDPRAFWARGRALAALGKRAEARKDLEKAIEMDPLSAGTRFELSRVIAGRVAVAPKEAAGAATAVDAQRDDEEKIKNPEARTLAGLAAELDPENDGYRRWFEQFEAP